MRKLKHFYRMKIPGRSHPGTLLRAAPALLKWSFQTWISKRQNQLSLNTNRTSGAANETARGGTAGIWIEKARTHLFHLIIQPQTFHLQLAEIALSAGL